MTLDGSRIELSVRLLQNGRYTWTITTNQPLEDAQGGIEILRMVDGQLRDKFPNHVQISNAKVTEIKDALDFF